MSKSNGNGVHGEDAVVITATTNYGKFVYDPRNRPIDWDHVQELFDSICENNLLEDFPIVVELRAGHHVVLDGQHRLEVAKILECPIYYKVSENMTFDDIHRINGVNMSWDSSNYLNRWLREGKTEYLRYRAFIEKYPHISPNFAMGLCMIGGAKPIRQAFRNGSYVCDNMEMAEKLGEASRSMEQYAPGFWTHTYFLAAIRALLMNPNYDHSIMLRKLDYQSTKLRKCADSKAYLSILLDIYNFKSRGPELTMDGVNIKSNPRRRVEYA